MRTKLHIISDIELRLNSLRLPDRQLPSREYLFYLFQQLLESLVPAYYEGLLKGGFALPQDAMKELPKVAALRDDQPFVAGGDFHELVMPLHPMRLSGDRGLVSIHAHDGLPVRLLSRKELEICQRSHFTKANPSNLLGYRIENVVRIFGMDDCREEVSADVVLLPSLARNAWQDSDLLPLPDELMEPAVAALLENLRKLHNPFLTPDTPVDK
jgi:hypothetical protein